MCKLKPYEPQKEFQISDHIFSTKIKDLFYIHFTKNTDKRGSFSELIVIPEIEQITNNKFVTKQINFSFSKTNVVRGLHAEDWNKLVFVTYGKVLNVLVDIRHDSPTFLNVESFVFNGTSQDENFQGGIYISKGIANGFAVLDGPAGYLYCVDRIYADRNVLGDKAISVFDPDLNIEWPIKKDKMVISQRDRETTTIRELFPNKFKR